MIPSLLSIPRSLMMGRSAASKRASMRASLLPALIKSWDALSPRSTPKASTIIDLPAPVSPVRTFSPGWKTIVRSSIMVKSLILSSRSIPLTLQQSREILFLHRA